MGPVKTISGQKNKRNSITSTTAAAENEVQEPAEPEPEPAEENPEDLFLQYLSSNDQMRENVDMLLQVSDFYSNLLTHHPNERPYDFVDVITGWEATVPCPIYAATSPNTGGKKRRGTKTFTDWDERRQSYKTPDCSFNELNSALVEPHTYRYVPNNGRYRFVKEQRRTSGPQRIETNYTFMPPKRPSLHTEQRLTQRQAHFRTLDKKVDDYKDEDEEQSSATNAQSDSNVAEEKPVQKKKYMKDGFHPPTQIRTGTKDFRQRKKELTFVQPSPSSDKDKGDDSNLLSKAFTETIMKNFTSKITAMEEQIRGEADWLALTTAGATHLHKITGKRSNSIPSDMIRVLPVSKQTLKPLQKTKQHAKGNISSTGPQNTPRQNYLESYILNPLNLEAARPKHTRSDSQVRIGSNGKNRGKPRSKDSMTPDECSSEIHTSPIPYKPTVRDKGSEIQSGADIITPSVTLPELFGKKLEVTVSAQKWL